MGNKSEAAQNAITLPKGGGALKGIGETFQANLLSGTGNYSVPLATSPGRNGFGPSLSLQYSSGNGNGLFGLGWQLSLPRITRKTEKGLPQYGESDTFVLSGVEDLVPCLRKVVDPSGEDSWAPEDPVNHPQHTAYRYRPRIEGFFARIERWVNNDTGEVHWRAITKDNVTNIYGGTSSSRISDPEDDQRVFEWLLQETFDALGNHIVYEYARDNPQLYANDADGGLVALSDVNRQATQLYIRRIYYGNLPDPLVDGNGIAISYPDGTQIGHQRGDRRYAFEVVFDYGDWPVPTSSPHPGAMVEGLQELFGLDPATGSEQNPVPIRRDCFSNFRARFEIRTLRRCRRVLMFHHFAELGGPTLVRSTDLEYRNDPNTLLSLLTAITVTSFRKDGTGSYKSASMPPVTFNYSSFRPHEQHYQTVAVQDNDLPSVALNDPEMALVDLFGDGLPDVLQSSSAGFRYWRNRGGGCFDRPRPMPQIPTGISLARAGIGFGDLGGDGQADLLVHSGPLPGFFETTSETNWQTFKPYEVFPSFDPGDPNVRMVDLTGNGLSDALMTQEGVFTWFECLGEKGFAPPRQVARKRDLDEFPEVSFHDPAGRVRLADMTGDGLNDIVLIHNGRIDYWPNIGYGQFGKRITMENAPHLEVAFSPQRLFLADLNGTGSADLVYVDFDRVHFWFNRSGNSWSDPETIWGTPPVSDVDSIQFADVFGAGTATLLWSYEFSAQPEGNYKALDFCGGVKPYVLTEMSNHMGTTTRVSYAPSTRYFLEDEINGTPWITKLPFPVQVVDKVEIIDHVSKTKLVTTYKYHHGYFDGREREFRGFGRVDQFDTETFEDFTRLHPDDRTDSFDNNRSNYHVPPVETRSWFHTGIYFSEDFSADASNPFDYRELTNNFRKEFYQGDKEAVAVAEHAVETEETPHEAYSALRGAVLRVEVYAHDGRSQAAHPYQVTENRYRIRQLQPKGRNQHAVHSNHPIESLSYHYERHPSDPRVSHALTLEVDIFGNPLKSMSIGYGRRQRDQALPTQADRDKQSQTFITYVQSSYTNAIDDAENYRTPLVNETHSYELTGFTLEDPAERFNFDEWIKDDFSRIREAVTISYEETADLTRTQKRLIEHFRTYYRKNDLTDLLPLGTIESLAIPGESYKLVFTPGMITKVYGNRVTDSMLLDAGGYTHLEGDTNWWIPLGRIFYSPNVEHTPTEELAFARQHFFLPRGSRDPFGNTTFTGYDAYDLVLKQTTDALGNRAITDHDYRILQAFRVTDPNGNRAEVAFDTLGLVVGTAVMGKPTESQGDSLSDFVPDLTPQQRQEFVTAPLAHAAQLLGDASTRIVYDIDCYRTSQQPIYAATLTRETHASDPLPSGGLKIRVSFSYSDGFGREIQQRIPAEPGPLVANGPVVSPRWVASGSALFNNKGRPVKQFEPFFDDVHEFRSNSQVGTGSTLFYDPVERVIATLHPNHTWKKVIFDPWRQESWDVNDTELIAEPNTDPETGEFFQRLSEAEYLPTWHALRESGALGPIEQATAVKTAIHAASPSVAYADSLGRTFLTIAHNRFERSGSIVEEKYSTRVIFDIEGNQREVIDANGRIVMRSAYDILRTRVYQASMEAGERWLLNDVAGQLIYAWDSRGHRFRTTYDALRRPVESFLRESNGSELMIGRSVYGEVWPNSEVNNLRGRVVQLFDQAGVVTSDEYDFKGNLLVSRRQLTREYKNTLDWTTNPQLETETFRSKTTYDALNRPLSTISPDGSIYHPAFNEANLLENVDVKVRGSPIATPLITNIDYNAKGQRTRIEYGNGARTDYEYDPLTFRLRNLKTLRGLEVLQDLSYTYDPIGNITHIHDQAQQTIYFNNQVVAPSADYTYDATYRLIQAEGREHIGQISRPETTWNDQSRVRLAQPGDGQAMRRYTEHYGYDSVGNFLQLIHQATNGNWSRSYSYNEASLIEEGKKSNRLSNSTVGAGSPESHAYDAHGNMTALPHLPAMEWDYQDRLRATSHQVVDAGTRETTYYVYDSAGQRARKVSERQNGTRKSEHLYLGGFEVYREYDGSGDTVTLEREILHVMDDKQRIALVETKTVEGQFPIPVLQPLFRYQLGNHLGSSCLELSDQAQIISYEEYYPYGSTSYQAVRSQVEAPKRYRYTGLERDEESGLAYHAARYYSPWLGRWISSDPKRFDFPDWSSYSYAFSNPLRFIDPTGQEPEKILRRHITEHAEDVTRNAAEVENLRTDLEKLNDKVQQARAEKIAESTIERNFARQYRDLSSTRDVAVAAGRSLEKTEQALREQLERVEAKLGRRVTVHVERPNEYLGDVLEKSKTQLRNQISTAKSLDISIPKPPPPPSTPQKSRDIPEARVLKKSWLSKLLEKLKPKSLLKMFTPKNLAVNAIKGYDIYTTYEQIKAQPTLSGQVEEASAWGGRLAGAAMGAKYGSALGPWGAAAGAILGGLIGESAVRTVFGIFSGPLIEEHEIREIPRDRALITCPPEGAMYGGTVGFGICIDPFSPPIQ